MTKLREIAKRNPGMTLDEIRERVYFRLNQWARGYTNQNFADYREHAESDIREELAVAAIDAADDRQRGR